jgi:homoaconitase/3-isopropylmalate dehydratase large subunit
VLERGLYVPGKKTPASLGKQGRNGKFQGLAQQVKLLIQLSQPASRLVTSSGEECPVVDLFAAAEEHLQSTGCAISLAPNPAVSSSVCPAVGTAGRGLTGE